jgi:uncharacterized phiE125 gp8 family phage protein
MIYPSTIVYVTPHSPAAGITPYRSLIRHTPPDTEPVTLAEAKAHCRVDISDDDTYINTLIAVAREVVEDRLGQTLMQTVWEARYDCFPLHELVLPRGPMADANVTVVYRNEAGVDQTLTSDAGHFQRDHRTTPGRIFANYAATWPAVRGDENSVTVRWTAGHADATDVPAVCKHAMLLLVGLWYGTREPVTAGTTAQNAPVPYTFETLMAHASDGVYR